MNHQGIWVLAEQLSGHVQRVSYELLARGRLLADKRRTELTAVLMTRAAADADIRQLLLCGADRVIVMQHEALEHFLPEPYCACLLNLVRSRSPEVVLAAATSVGRTIMPMVAALAHTGLTADCTELEIDASTGNLLQTRPAIGGNILATIQTPRHRPQMVTVRPRSAAPAASDASREALSRDAGRVERVVPAPELLATRVRRVGFVPADDKLGLQDADRVVCAGRGIKRAATVEMIRKLAGAMGAAVGASRDVVDRGWMSYPHQVGLSGKTISPSVYVGVGVSGSIQHLAGMQTSKTIIAINTDPDAQIFRVADVGIVGNLFDVVPALIERLGRKEDRP
jgi:electron transfer flavoprotein alpha subunit